MLHTRGYAQDSKYSPHTASEDVIIAGYAMCSYYMQLQQLWLNK